MSSAAIAELSQVEADVNSTFERQSRSAILHVPHIASLDSTSLIHGAVCVKHSFARVRQYSLRVSSDVRIACHSTDTYKAARIHVHSIVQFFYGCIGPSPFVVIEVLKSL